MKIFEASYASGTTLKEAIVMAINTSLKKSFESNSTISTNPAPTTLQTPISFCLHWAMKVDRPISPRHEINVAMPAKYFATDATICSD